MDKLLVSEWLSIKNRISSILLSSNILKSDDALRVINSMDGLNKIDKKQIIINNWGVKYLESLGPLLDRMEFIESAIEKS